MGHLPVINRGIIYLLSNTGTSPLASSGLLHEIASSPDEVEEAPTADLLMDIHRMTTEMQTLGELRPFTSRRQVRECYDRVYVQYPERKEQLRLEAERLAIARAIQIDLARPLLEEAGRTARRGFARRAAANRVEHAGGGQRDSRKREPSSSSPPFPPPPISGTETIIPLTSTQALWEEGRRQRNCLRSNLSYVDKVLNGTLYIYRVLDPERCTLAISRKYRNSWGISELKGLSNWSVKTATREHIKAWLSANQVSL
jgi:hypothetical protein